jgi:hypothetical protein
MGGLCNVLPVEEHAGQERTPLQELVSNRLLELGLSYREAASRSQGLLSHSTFSRLCDSKRWAGRVTGRTVSGLALALDLPESRVRKAAEVSILAEDFSYYASMFRNLPPADQAEVIKLMQDRAKQRAAEAAAKRKAAQPFRK